ncbi:uncharacterized protein LOC125206141 [Salvia hispanica]|uniref:uncharacterized protein LOC125206141 n=1 Tax=Salvia hispanica TaxID=49212 RepID=UPI0020098B00|nr:uncharacterized protein LOC125206141 [Salvia hispanica]
MHPKGPNFFSSFPSISLSTFPIQKFPNHKTLAWKRTAAPPLLAVRRAPRRSSGGCCLAVSAASRQLWTGDEPVPLPSRDLPLPPSRGSHDTHRRFTFSAAVSRPPSSALILGEPSSREEASPPSPSLRPAQAAAVPRAAGAASRRHSSPGRCLLTNSREMVKLVNRGCGAVAETQSPEFRQNPILEVRKEGVAVVLFLGSARSPRPNRLLKDGL